MIRREARFGPGSRARAAARILLLALAGLARAQGMLPGGSCWVQDAASAGRAVWLLCEREQALASDDQGQSWHAVRLPTEAKLRAVAFRDPLHGFIGGESGTLLATEDGGRSWRPVGVPTGEHLTDIYFLGRLGWISGYGGLILHSADGGATWTRQFTGVSQPLESIFFADAEHGWAAGWAGTILRTADGGRTWQPAYAPEARHTLSSVYFRNERDGWIVGMFGQILRTRDGGASWTLQGSPVRSWLKAVIFDPAGRGWIAGGTDLLVSEDGGETWRRLEGDDRPFVHRFVLAADALWAVGPFAALRGDLQGRTWVRLEPRFSG